MGQWRTLLRSRYHHHQRKICASNNRWPRKGKYYTVTSWSLSYFFQCEKCGFNNIDLTDGLFAVWGGDGVLQGEWEYGTSAAAPPPPPPPKKTTTTPPAPKPTSTKIPPTTSNPVPTSTTKITPSSTHASSSTEISSSTSQSTSSTSKTSTGSLPDPTSQSVQNLELLYLANLGIGGIAFSSLHN